MRVVLADDQYRVRYALRVLLGRQPDLEISAEAVNGMDLLAHAVQVCPDLVLLDWELPGLSVVELLLALRRLCPDTRVIVMSGRPEARAEAAASDVDMFVSKAYPPERLLEAVRQVQATLHGSLVEAALRDDA
jgi:two-component system response regulator DesR